MRKGHYYVSHIVPNQSGNSPHTPTPHFAKTTVPLLIRGFKMTKGARLPLLALSSAALLVASLFVGSGGASADTDPPSTSTPKTVAADALPTVQINGVVWAQVIVGNTVYVGGEFTKARPAGSAAGTNEVTRNNMLAYNLSTGVMTSFNPNVNAAVRALAVSADRTRVYAAGNFTTVGGVSRSRVAAFDAASGALVSSWAPTVNGNVKAIGVSSSKVYVGGSFSSASGQSRRNMAAFATSNGALQSWNGTVSGGTIQALAVSPDGTKVIIGGSFTSYNGGNNPGYGMAATDATTGASLPWKVNSLIRNGGTDAAILSLVGSAEGVFGSGYVFGTGGNLEGAFRATWADGTLVWVEDCHGDTYSVAPATTVVYTTGHPHFCGNIGGYKETSPRTYYRTLTFTMNATGTITRNSTGNYYNYEGKPRPTLLHYYPDINTGSYTGQGQGPWNIAVNSQYVLYGGEFTIVNNKRQQGLVRFPVSSIAPNKEGPRLQGAEFAPTLSAPLPGTIRVSWTSNYDRDNEKLTYQVLRNGVSVAMLTGLSSEWKRPTMSWTDTGRTSGTTYTYQIKVTDPFGNTKTGNSASMQATGAGTVETPDVSTDPQTDGLKGTNEIPVDPVPADAVPVQPVPVEPAPQPAPDRVPNEQLPEQPNE
jgi:hypothetical protein